MRDSTVVTDDNVGTMYASGATKHDGYAKHAIDKIYGHERW